MNCLIFLNLKVWFRVASIVFAFLSFIYTVTEYHVLLDGKYSQLRKQLKIAPFFTINLFFRCYTLSLMWVYWKRHTIVVCIFLYFVNLIITRRTLLKEFNERTYQHLTFCYVVGGMTSILTPALALFYGQTANKTTINYFYKKNIRVNNMILIVIFLGLLLHLNIHPDDRSLLNRNAILGCHQDHLNYTKDEFGIFDDDQFRDVSSKTNKLLFLGRNWTVREATNYECLVEEADHLLRSRYLIAEDCDPGQRPIDMFNFVAAPLVGGLWLLSLCTTLPFSCCEFEME